MVLKICPVALGLVSVLLIGCASSGVSVVKMDMRARPGVTLVVLPFKVQGTAQVAQDWRKTGEVVATPDGKVVETGMYQYTVEGEDVTNLRKSLIGSLRKGGAFASVLDLRPAELPVGAWVMEVTLGKRGMEQTTTRSTCFIHGHVSIKEQERVLKEADVAANGTSLMTVGAAKDEALENFVRSVLEIVNQT